MRYKITRKYLRGEETPFAQFIDLADAQLFVENKLAADAALSVKVLYKTYDKDKCISESDTSQSGIGQDQNSSAGKGNAAAFRPTPFNLAPRPKGMPSKWLEDDKDDKEDEKDK